MGVFHMQPSEIYNMDAEDFHFFKVHAIAYIEAQNKANRG